MSNKSDVPSIIVAKEHREAIKLGEPSKFYKLQKAGLIIFAVLAAGMLELVFVYLTK